MRPRASLRNGVRGSAARGDLLDLLLQARDEETGRVMTDAELVRNLATFMLAGHETTAVALTWTLWLLAKYPYVQDQIASEAQATIGSSGAVEAQQVERRGSRPSAAPGAGLAQWSVASGTAHRARAASVAIVQQVLENDQSSLGKTFF